MIVTIVSAGPLLGVKPLTVAAHVKYFSEVTVPLGVLTEIGPVPGQAPAGTVAWILVVLSTVYDAAGIVLNWTPGAPSNPVPLIVTIVPAGPLLGEKLLTVAAHVKLFTEVAVPPGVVVTEIGPVSGQAPVGTRALIRVGPSTSNTAEFPLN